VQHRDQWLVLVNRIMKFGSIKDVEYLNQLEGLSKGACSLKLAV
jgi:hypothetical protein